MKPRIILLLIVQGIISSTLLAQNYIKIGTQAPAFKVGKWLKGDEVSSFKKDHIYVVEFWATWCKPCIANMPHLTEIAKKYKDKNVHVIGVDASDGNMSTDSLQAFVNRMGNKMDYSVVIDNKERFMGLNWLKLAGSVGIPKSFLVDQKGNIAWIGHPGLLEPVLDKVLTGDINYQEIDRTIERDAPKPKWALEPESPKITENIQKMQELITQKKYDEAFLIYDHLQKTDPYTASGLTTNAIEALLNIDFKRALNFYKQLINDDAPQLLMTVYYITSLKENLPKEFYELSKHVLLRCVKQQPYINFQPYFFFSLAEAYFHLNESNKAAKIINNRILFLLMSGQISPFMEYCERKLKKYKQKEINTLRTKNFENLTFAKKLTANKRDATTDDKLDAILISKRINSDVLLDSLKSKIQKIDYYNAYMFTVLLEKEEKKAFDFAKGVLTKQNDLLDPREIILMSFALKNKLATGPIQNLTSTLGLEFCDQGLKKLDKIYSFFFYDLQSMIYANDGKYQEALDSKQKMLACLEKYDYSEVLEGGDNFLEYYKTQCKISIAEYKRKLSSTK